MSRRWRSIRGRLGVALFLSGVAVALPTAAQLPPTSESPPSAASQLEEIQKKIAMLRTSMAEWKAKSDEYSQTPQRLRVVQEEIAALQARQPPPIREKATAAELDMELAKAEQDLAVARREVSELESEAARRADRRKKLPGLLAAARERSRKLAMAPPPAAEVDPQVFAALSELQNLRRAAVAAEVEAYENEINSYDPRGVLLARRRDLADMRVAYHEAWVSQLQEAVDKEQRIEVERRAVEAEQLLAKLETYPPEIRNIGEKLATENAELAEKWTGDDGVVDKIKAVDQKLLRAQAKVKSIDSELSTLQEKLEAVGLKDSVGVLLRKERADAPDVGMYRRFIRMRQELIGSVQLQLIKLREQREELGSVDSLVDQAMLEVGKPVSKEDEAQIARTLRQLFETQREYLDALIVEYETYFQKLIDFDARQQELIERTERLTKFIDERVLWIPSGSTVQATLFSDGVPAVEWLVSPRFLGQLGRAARAAVEHSLPLNAVLLFLTVLMATFTRRIHRRIVGLGQQAQNYSCVRYAPTLRALALTLILAFWLPALLAYLAWRLGASPEATQYVRCVANGMWAAAALWATLRLPRQLLMPGGILEAHCGWPKAAAKTLRRHLAWLAGVSIPAVFSIFVFERRGEEAWTESIGRLSFLIVVVALAVFFHFVTRNKGPLWQVLYARGAPRRPWIPGVVHVVAVLTPILLGAAALRGYYWTALQLVIRLHFTLVFLFLVWVALHLSARWLLVTRRNIAVEQARLRAEARDAERRKAALEGEAPTEEQAPVEEEVDLASVEVQTSRLMLGAAVLAGALGILAIWADVLPAAGMLRQVELWSATQTVTTVTPDASGVEQASLEEQLVPVTLADLLLALIIAGLTLALMRNLPGMLEVSLFRRLSAGERYAYITIVKYAVALVGIVVAFDAIGIGWSNIQWLVAAVGLGLGFGLQEIFANFMSGLIILFERPIRVGDTVTVGNISGTVTKIRIRATWITGFDRKELVVPNKEFVTSKLINWSLSDQVLRLDIPVGIAYGSDTTRAIEVLTKVARENEHLLEDPAPQVLFLGFGDSSLSFELRVFISGVARLFEVRHELHMAIDRAFREAGIEIAFPQRDLHVRSVPANWNPAAS